MNVQLNCITQPIVQTEDLNSARIGTGRNLYPEEYIIYAARVSSSDRLNNETAPKLLKYLIDHKHWSPFEMISIGIEIETSRAIAQQILRHRSFSFQEFSQRYAEANEIEPFELRKQADKNRQSSTKKIDDDKLIETTKYAVEYAKSIYNELIRNGVAKECARMVLPLSTQTTMVMHGTLRSWIHFFEQRCSEHAQQEIQDIAYAARDLVSAHCPWTASALGWNKENFNE